MYKGKIRNDTPVLANANIPFTTEKNTNKNTTPDTTNNHVTVNKAGYYNLFATIQVTDIATSPVSVNILANNDVVATAQTDITADTGIATLTVIDVERVIYAPLLNMVNFEVQLDVAGTVLGGSTFIIQEVR